MRGFKDVDPSDIDTKTLFARVAKENEAQIEAEEHDSSVIVIVKATHRAAAKKIIGILRERLLYQPGEEDVWCARLLIDPPRDGKVLISAVLQPKERVLGRRIVMKDSNPVDSNGVTTIKLDYLNEMIENMDSMARILRQHPGGMHMRVQFGILMLEEWKKDQTSYRLSELSSMVRRAGSRGTTHMLNG